jgi:deoxyribodipyrimidine photo-lyase
MFKSLSATIDPMTTIVWHRRDLRPADNRALAEASDRGPVLPVALFDPDRPLRSPARTRFLLESLKDLGDWYREHGCRLRVITGDLADLHQLATDTDADVVFNLDESCIDSVSRQRQAIEYGFEAFGEDAVVRSGESRDGWREQARSYLRGEMITPLSDLEAATMEEPPGEEVGTVIDRHMPTVEADVPDGGREDGRERLRTFVRSIERYPSSISSPSEAERHCSRLSPYIAAGCLSVREIYQAVHRASGPDHAKEMFLDRLVWHQHFRQKLQDNPDLTEEAVNPVYQGLHREDRDERLIDAWKNGRTGFPMVDAAMRALVETGFINFRMRSMCASFYSYILKQWWKEGADFMYRHFLDADAAINYGQWQMQSGLVGVHANRIYDPVKQWEENDPDGAFIREYIPELRELPDAVIGAPWRLSEDQQEEYGVRIGQEYPERIVNYDREARKAREFFSRKADAARAAFADDAVWEKASLSDRHDREAILAKANDEGSEDLGRYL